MLCQESNGRNGDGISHCVGTTQHTDRRKQESNVACSCPLMVKTCDCKVWTTVCVAFCSKYPRKKRKKSFALTFVKVCLIHANHNVCLCSRLSLLVRGSLRLKAWERFQASCSIGLLHPATKTKVQPRTRSCRGSSPSNTAWATQSVTSEFHKHQCSVGSLNPDVN